MTAIPTPQSIPDGYSKDISRAIARSTIFPAEAIEKMIIKAGSVDIVLKAIHASLTTNRDPWFFIDLFASSRSMRDWHRIESAPRDGTPVLICEGDTVAIAQFREWIGSHEWVAVEVPPYDDPTTYEPTHWMRLPEPPPPPHSFSVRT